MAGLIIVYDGLCPVCSNYVQALKLREAVGALELINAREDSQIVDDIRHRGFDLNEGMIVIYAGAMYYAADAVNLLAILSSDSSAFNRLNAWAFKNKRIARLLYPILKFGRMLLLRLLGRRRIEG